VHAGFTIDEGEEQDFRAGTDASGAASLGPRASRSGGWRAAVGGGRAAVTDLRAGAVVDHPVRRWPDAGKARVPCHPGMGQFLNRFKQKKKKGRIRTSIGSSRKRRRAGLERQAEVQVPSLASCPFLTPPHQQQTSGPGLRRRVWLQQ